MRPRSGCSLAPPPSASCVLAPGGRFGRLRVLVRRRASPFGDGRFRDEMKGKIPIFPIDINRFY